MTTPECPNCKDEVSQIESECSNCGFPLDGTEKEKSIFIGRQIFNKSKIGDAKESQGKAQKILYIIGAFQLLNAFLAYNNSLGLEPIIFYIILGGLLIVFGYLSSKKPILYLSLALGIILFYYVLLYLISPEYLFRGILWKIVTVLFLVYGISNSFEEKNLKKKYNFLKKE